MRNLAHLVSATLITSIICTACAGDGASNIDAADAADDLRLQEHPFYADFIANRSADLTQLYRSTPNRFYTSPSREKWTYTSYYLAEGSRIATDAQVFWAAGVFAEETLGQQEDAIAIRATRTFSRRNVLTGVEVESLDEDDAKAMAAMTRVSGRALYSQGLRIGNNLYVAVFARHRRNLLAARREYGLIFQATNGDTRLLGAGYVGQPQPGLVPTYRIVAGHVLPAVGNEASADEAAATLDDVADVGATDPGLPGEDDA